MQINNVILMNLICAVLFIGKNSYSQSVANTSWVRYDKSSSDYTPFKMEYFFYAGGKYIEVNTNRNGQILTYYEGEWSLLSDSIYLTSAIVIGYSFESKVYFKDSVEREIEKYHTSFYLMKRRMFWIRESNLLKVKMKWKKQKSFNDEFNFGAKIVEVEHVKIH